MVLCALILAASSRSGHTKTAQTLMDADLGADVNPMSKIVSAADGNGCPKSPMVLVWLFGMQGKTALDSFPA